jgi:hypothetical protein
MYKNLDGTVGIATGYGLEGRGVGVRVPAEARFSFLHVVQTGSGAHSASYPVGTGSSLVKRRGSEPGHSPQINAAVKNTWKYTSTPPYAFIV